jgi:hypothetical protein
VAYESCIHAFCHRPTRSCAQWSGCVSIIGISDERSLPGGAVNFAVEPRVPDCVISNAYPWMTHKAGFMDVTDDAVKSGLAMGLAVKLTNSRVQFYYEPQGNGYCYVRAIAPGGYLGTCQ